MDYLAGGRVNQIIRIGETVHRPAGQGPFMQSEAERGNEAFKANIADGHHLTYLDDIAYLQTHEQAIQKGLLKITNATKP
ncbi:hypothetical protein QUF64_10460 [Anaerolineales bacterium HSG6]|nr:hypothetical protein [Anaerolineales bacterium HSG6]